MPQSISLLRHDTFFLEKNVLITFPFIIQYLKNVMSFIYWYLIWTKDMIRKLSNLVCKLVSWSLLDICQFYPRSVAWFLSYTFSIILFSTPAYFTPLCAFKFMLKWRVKWIDFCPAFLFVYTPSKIG